MFSLIFNSLYLLINFYIFIRGRQSLINYNRLRKIYYVLIALFVSAFPLSSPLNALNSSVSKIFYLIGIFWLAGMLHFFIVILLLDIGRLLNHFAKIRLNIIIKNYSKIKILFSFIVIFVIFIMLIYGYINNQKPRITAFDINISKKADSLSSLNIIMVSDIHYGRSNGQERVEMLVNEINKLDPDIVVLAGDILDSAQPEYLDSAFGKNLSNIKSKFGTYGVIGNHDFLLNSSRVRKYFEEHGVIILKDSTAMIRQSVYLLGRRYAYGGNGDITRKEIKDFWIERDLTKPAILIDHRPFGLEQSVENNIDLQLSGHTHYGQLWPINYITDLIYDLNWGYRKVNKTNYYVSCGFSTWGPPIRLGSFPEIVKLKLNFN